MNLKKLPLKKTYYIQFLSLIVIPLLIVLFVALFVLNQRFKEQAIENIRRTQENIATELLLDVETMSLRLSHLVHTNNSEMLDYAAYADTDDSALRYEYSRKLKESGSLVFEPSSNLISVSFYMKDGRQIYINSEVQIPEVEDMDWYQCALQETNQVMVGSYFIQEKGEVYLGSRGNSMLLAFALAPDRTTDRNEKIEMVVIYYGTDVGDKIASYNKKYLDGKNSLGLMQIVNEDGTLLFSSDGELQEESGTLFGVSDGLLQEEAGGYTCIRTPVDVNNAVWYVESYIKTSKLTSDFRQIAGIILVVAVCILAFAGYFSRYLLKGIVSPIEEISDGLKQVEEGKLDVHIAPQGQSEVRNMIHQFNAMARRLKVLIGEYEEQVKRSKVNPADSFAAMLRKEMTPREVAQRTAEFFAEEYLIFNIYVDGKEYVEKKVSAEKPAAEEEKASTETGSHQLTELLKCCERNPRFASRCIAYTEGGNEITVLYRVMEQGYHDTVIKMLQELQQEIYKILNLRVSVCISRLAKGPDAFYEAADAVKEHMSFRHLYGENAIVDLDRDGDVIAEIAAATHAYDKFAEALYTADEKNISDEREKVFAFFINHSMEESRITVLAVILAIANTFSKDYGGFAALFGQQKNYMEKISRISDVKSMKLWLTNYCAWILNYSAAKLNITETDVIVKAKRYIAEHCEDAELSLTEVAEHVGLNEKYFTNRFTKETGETFSTYLTGLRMQKARELLRTTSFKIYEISEMVGYRNVEHFNRVFKKENSVTPAQFRKNG